MHAHICIHTHICSSVYPGLKNFYIENIYLQQGTTLASTLRLYKEPFLKYFEGKQEVTFDMVRKWNKCLDEHQIKTLLLCRNRTAQRNFCSNIQSMQKARQEKLWTFIQKQNK